MPPRVTRPESADPRDIAMFVDSRFDDLRSDLLDHIDSRFDEQRRLLLAAFPTEDAAAHRLWHQQRNEADAENKDLRQSVKRWGAVGLIGTLATWNWDAIKEALKAWFR